MEEEMALRFSLPPLTVDHYLWAIAREGSASLGVIF